MPKLTTTAPAPTFTRAKLHLDQLKTHDDFTFRDWFDTAHLRDLRQVLTNNPRKALDPLLVWQGPDGAFYLLDGAYRTEAYRQAGQGSRKVPVRVFHGDRDGAILEALRDNAKAKLPLSSMERQDAAWRLVRMPPKENRPRYAKPQIADASGVSERQVGYMRKRWKEAQAEGPEAVAALTGRWFKDRDSATPEGNFEMLDDAERKRQIEALAEGFRDLTDRRKHGDKMPILGDSHAVYEALYMAYGAVWARGFLDFTAGDEEEADGWAAPFSVDVGDEEEAVEPAF